VLGIGFSLLGVAYGLARQRLVDRAMVRGGYVPLGGFSVAALTVATALLGIGLLAVAVVPDHRRSRENLETARANGLRQNDEAAATAALFVSPRKVDVVTLHTVESTSETVRSGFLDPTAPSVATIESGDVVSYPNTWFHWGNEAKFGMSFAEREPLRHRYPNGPYSMLGPVEVAGSEPGDVIECRLLSLRTQDWGWNSFPLGVGALPADFDQPYVHYFRFDESRQKAEFVEGITLSLAPFLGVIGVEPAGDAPVSAILAGPYGGNLVLRELTVGSSLFLPVMKPGGRVWTGDVHALQGDGVVDQTAIETAAEELQIRYDLHKGVALTNPLAETPTHWIGIGFAENLDDALVACLRELITWMHLASGISEGEAYALCSMAVNFRITQYSHQTGSAYSAIPPKAVHGMVPKSVFPPALTKRIDQWLRPKSADST
jgi:acetamidase/formamidase